MLRKNKERDQDVQQCFWSMYPCLCCCFGIFWFHFNMNTFVATYHDRLDPCFVNLNKHNSWQEDNSCTRLSKTLQIVKLLLILLLCCAKPCLFVALKSIPEASIWEADQSLGGLWQDTVVRGSWVSDDKSPALNCDHNNKTHNWRLLAPWVTQTPAKGNQGKFSSTCLTSNYCSTWWTKENYIISQHI